MRISIPGNHDWYGIGQRTPTAKLSSLSCISVKQVLLAYLLEGAFHSNGVIFFKNYIRLAYNMAKKRLPLKVSMEASFLYMKGFSTHFALS